MFKRLKVSIKRWSSPKLNITDLYRIYFAIFRKVIINEKTILELHPQESTCVAKLDDIYIKLSEFSLIINIADNFFMLELNSNYTSKLIKFFHLHTDIRRKKSEHKQEQKTIKLLKNYYLKL